MRPFKQFLIPIPDVESCLLFRKRDYSTLFQDDKISRYGLKYYRYLYGNRIYNFDARSLSEIPGSTAITCVNPLNLPTVKVERASIAQELHIDGFNCITFLEYSNCTPCTIGTYGDTVVGGCHPCPVGGFYQDDIAQTAPSQSKWKIPCKLCNKGTYVKKDQDRKFNVTRLRSDFDVDCTGLQVYHVSAFILTVIYVIAFPAALLYLLCKNFCLPTRKKDSLIDDLPPDNTDDPTDLSALTNSPTYPSPPIWLNFLSENYKREFWFWEIVELARKVTQTLLITLFGWEDRLTVILTTCISVLFLLLHARYRPMKSSYEQGLQMFSLTVIFINVIVAANDFPDEHENSIITVLVVLNVIVLVIIAGKRRYVEQHCDH
ncbi:hypothetical protein BSL78_18242 [Apostichopus japonicus]|uniref:Tyrosine-protein kinase ephrin type A/B receptor-like domain-containing protein n=1 Tax=Stichopus japonicus TaxID=307972 RepID=A0A2G8KA77_STIJA|nr:hypothetical protein BSL78_18242 [Apostichopus japonicus]